MGGLGTSSPNINCTLPVGTASVSRRHSLRRVNCWRQLSLVWVGGVRRRLPVIVVREPPSTWGRQVLHTSRIAVKTFPVPGGLSTTGWDRTRLLPKRPQNTVEHARYRFLAPSACGIDWRRRDPAGIDRIACEKTEILAIAAGHDLNANGSLSGESHGNS